MFINSIKLKNFRCFKNNKFNFDSRLVLIEGDNASGKTSLLESLYFPCYLRSFRTRLSKEVVEFEQDHFFLEVDFKDNFDLGSLIQVGYSDKDGKLVKLNQKQVQSYRDIISCYKVISITEDDLLLVGKGPEGRRGFLNQSLFLLDPGFVCEFRKYKQILDQRNAFLIKNVHKSVSHRIEEELLTWTKQLWEQSLKIQKARIDFLSKIEDISNDFLKNHFSTVNTFFLSFIYLPRNIVINQNFDLFWEKYKKNILEKELRWGRSLFGAHLDDFSITFKNQKARLFASRGQQKLILFLLKISQLQMLKNSGNSGVLLLDDFLTDFDSTRVTEFLTFFQELDYQIFITCPLKSFLFSKVSKKNDFQITNLL